MIRKERYDLEIPLTIESQLERFSKVEGHTDRHETLWHAWYQNKRWICQLLETILVSFPTYSRHDESHALSVLNNIEMILGQDRIAQLSATDCFVLLHAVYLHDVGMCILKTDRKEIIENEDFIELMDVLEKDGEDNVKRAITALKRTDYNFSNEEEHIAQMRQLYNAKLEVYYAIVEMLADFRRSEHGNKSAERLYKWIKEPQKLGVSFSMAGVPLRIFIAVAKCAQMHTNNNFGDIMKLPRKDGGFASDYYHPRFIAVLLMLGDILDMDNDRFHPLVMEFVEDFPEASKSHYDKHRAIRRLSINPDVIEIEADCDNQSALRLVRKECDMLADILKNAGYLWSSICPEEFTGTLPNLSVTDLYLRDTKIPEELVTTKFHIAQEKAFAILEGSNIYEGRYVFLREFLQNAIDATKCQYWKDYSGTAAYYSKDDNIHNLTPAEMNKKLPFDRYPIVIAMKMQQKMPGGKLLDVHIEDFSKEQSAEGNYGVLVSIKDFGTGIDKERIIDISKVGNSRRKEKKALREMPKWLRPTAEFGVGLQSAFLVNDDFKCYTYTRSGESYEITFASGASRLHEGYINVAPIKVGENASYGTCFEIFVPLERKFLHSESVCTWSGKDPFSADYDATRPIRHVTEMMSQMILQLDNVLGELLFPVQLKIHERDQFDLMINNRSGNTLKKLDLKGERNDSEERRPYWLFDAEKQTDRYYCGKMEGMEYALNYDNAHLYIWDSECDTACVVSGENVQRGVRSFKQASDRENRGITVYYKGIELQHRCYEKEIEIFEYIDIKGNLKREHINISRRGFTPEGERFFQSEIYGKLLEKVKKVLKDINKKSLESDSETPLAELKERALKKLENLSTERQMEDKSQYNQTLESFISQTVSMAILSHLAVKETVDDITIRGCGNDLNQECRWQECIKTISDKIQEYPVKNSVREDLKKASPFFNILCYRKDKRSLVMIAGTYNILDIFRKDRHYALFQKRINRYGRWMEYIFEIESVYDLFQKYFGEDTNAPDHIDTGNLVNDYFEKALKELADITTPDDSGGDNENQAITESTQQYFLTWLGKNVPVIGLFSDEPGNNRINVLSHHMYPYIFSNDHHKLLVLQRMIETSKTLLITRYSTYAWQGLQYLAVKRLSFSSFFVKRGYFNSAYLQRVIFPLDSEWLTKIENVMKEEENYCHKYVKDLTERLDIERYLSDLLKRGGNDVMLRDEVDFVNKIKEKVSPREMSGFINASGEFFNDIMREMMPDKSIPLNDGKEETQSDYMEYLLRIEKEWNKALREVALLYLSMVRNEGDSTQVKKMIQNDMIKVMAWFYHSLHNNQLIEVMQLSGLKRIREEYFEECHKNSVLKQKRERIIKYIANNSVYLLREEKIDACYRVYENEIFDLFAKQETARMKGLIKSWSNG